MFLGGGARHGESILLCRGIWACCLGEGTESEALIQVGKRALGDLPKATEDLRSRGRSRTCSPDPSLAPWPPRAVQPCLSPCLGSPGSHCTAPHLLGRLSPSPKTRPCPLPCFFLQPLAPHTPQCPPELPRPHRTQALHSNEPQKQGCGDEVMCPSPQKGAEAESRLDFPMACAGESRIRQGVGVLRHSTTALPSTSPFPSSLGPRAVDTSSAPVLACQRLGPARVPGPTDPAWASQGLLRARVSPPHQGKWWGAGPEQCTLGLVIPGGCAVASEQVHRGGMEPLVPSKWEARGTLPSRAAHDVGTGSTMDLGLWLRRCSYVSRG